MKFTRSLSRRRFVSSGLALATALRVRGAARDLGFASETGVCQLSPEQEVGPYYVAGELLRSDIRETKPGVPLSLRIAIVDARTCKPLPEVAVDIWHCDALGLYSGFTKQNPRGPGSPPPGMRGDGPPPGPPPGFDPQHPGNRPGPPEGFGPPPMNHPTDKLTFLRGIHLTDAQGTVSFQTIVPGFYMGRTNHIHFKARLGGSVSNHTYDAGHTSHTGQIFFPEDLAVKLMSMPPYTGHKIHRTTQAEDGVFNGQQGELSIAHITAVHPGDPQSGYHAEIVALVDPTATPSPAERGRPPGRLPAVSSAS